jgi:hypothetical protein
MSLACAELLHLLDQLIGRGKVSLLVRKPVIEAFCAKAYTVSYKESLRKNTRQETGLDYKQLHSEYEFSDA